MLKTLYSILILGILLSSVACLDENVPYIVCEADITKAKHPNEAMDSVIAVIEKRLEAYDATEATVEQVGENRIKVYLRGIEDIEETIQLIGVTSLVKFKEFVPLWPNNGETQIVSKNSVSYFALLPDNEGVPVLTEVEKSEAQWIAIPATGTIAGEKVELTSQYFKGTVVFGYRGVLNEPVITFDWDDVGSDLFYEITTRLSSKPQYSIDRRLGIFVGDAYESAPNVNEPIRGSGVIEGMDPVDAKRLAGLLNAGRFDITLSIVKTSGF